MDIFLTAYLKSEEEFLESFKPGDANKKDENGRGLVLMSLQNKHLPSRYAISNFLLDQGAPADTTGNGGASALHILFGQVSHDIEQDVRLARRLIAGGADINHADDNGRLPFVDVISMKFTDEDLQPIYDLWFEQPNPDFTSESRFGLSPLSAARKLPFRSEILSRMENHVLNNS